MKKFKFRIIHYLSYTLTIILATFFIYIFNRIYITIILSMCIIGSIVGITNSLFYCIIIDEKNVAMVNIFKRTSIQFSKIEVITKLPTSKGSRNFVGVYGSEKKIFITFWLKDYKNLLSIILTKCEKLENIKIDTRVKDLLK